MLIRKTVLIVLATAGIALAGRPRNIAYRQIADRDIDRAMEEAKRYLYRLQEKDGHWPHYHPRPPLPRGGPTALALLALLEGGEDPAEERMKKGLDALAALRTENLYVVATRAMVLAQVVTTHSDSPYRDRLVKDLNWLTANALREGAAWGYAGPERTGDNSCSQFALMALWEADRAGIAIDTRLLSAVEQTWVSRQKPDGGWTYAGQPQAAAKADSTLSMTTAGLASLYLCQDVLALAPGPYRHQHTVDAAWGFLVPRLDADYIKDEYLAFCVQRVGMGGGRKFIGEMDWFAAGAGVLCEPTPFGRQYRGQWGSVVRAAMELIFLSRGRIPLVFNKLRHGTDEAWNFHTRDVARFTEYARRTLERRMRWQVVDIRDDIQLLLDAPILLVSSTRAPEFSQEQWSALRQYTLRGGTLLMVATGGSKAFLDGARKALEGLYEPQRRQAGAHYELKPLPENHPVCTAHKAVESAGKIAPMWGVDDGTRLLAAICARDVAEAWQRSMTTTRRVDFDLGTNFFLYATGGNSMSTHLRPVFPGREGAGAGPQGEVRHRAKVVWVRHGANWCSQPYALEYLSQKLTAENRVAIVVHAGAEIAPDALRGSDLVWLTGSSSLALDEEQVEVLREYLRDGGTLLLNAVGGSAEFQRSARSLVTDLLPVGESRLRDVAPDSPLLTGKCGDFRGPAVGMVVRTNAFRLAVPEAPAPFQIGEVDGRAAVIFAPYGIHDTLDGHTAHGAKSYMPDSARDLAANVVLYALSGRPVATGPASRPSGAD